MINNRLNWAKKVPQSLIEKLYDNDSKQYKDDTLIDEAGWGLYARCMSIITVTEAYENKILACPVCENEKKMEYVLEPKSFKCDCGIIITWEDFKRSYKNKQLYGANALPVFVKFVNNFPKCKSYEQKMIAIDTLINSFHILHSYRNDTFTETPDESDRLGRPTGANLIEGTLHEVIDFLNYLSNK